MQPLIRKICLFVFLTVLLSGRTSELSVLVGALTGTVLLWPLYVKWLTRTDAP